MLKSSSLACKFDRLVATASPRSSLAKIRSTYENATERYKQSPSPRERRRPVQPLEESHEILDRKIGDVYSERRDVRGEAGLTSGCEGKLADQHTANMEGAYPSRGFFVFDVLSEGKNLGVRQTVEVYTCVRGRSEPEHGGNQTTYRYQQSQLSSSSLQHRSLKSTELQDPGIYLRTSYRLCGPSMGDM